MAIWDCFLFLNELKMLEIRLNTLYDHVDYFVIGESDESHAGNIKPYNFELNRDKFKTFENKIIYLKIPKNSEIASGVDKEHYQRSYLIKGLANTPPEDYIMISDIDEIPDFRNPNILNNLPNGNKPLVLQQKRHDFFLNWESTNWNWRCVAILKKKYVQDLQTLRMQGRVDGSPSTVIPNGWHFSYQGGIEAIKYKASCTSEHSLYGKPEVTNTDRLIQSFKNKELYWDPTYKYKLVEIDNTYPDYIVKNIHLFQDWIDNGDAY